VSERKPANSVEFKAGENFNRRNTLSISESRTSLTGGLKFEANEEIGIIGGFRSSTSYLSGKGHQQIQWRQNLVDRPFAHLSR